VTTDSSLSQQAQGSYIAQATGGGTATVQVVLPPPAVQEQNRVRFLAQLRAFYKDLWEQSLQGAAQLTLGLTDKPDVVLRHTELLLRAPQRPQRPLPEGTTLLDVYDEAGQELLLLGEPGAGKSTLLLELARQLVARAEQEPGHPFPVILPLPSWAVRQPPLTEWLSAQLSRIYDVPRQLSRAWVQTDLILPLLDGLDEVSQEARGACIEAINTYRKEHLVPLVVCSRRAEYEQLAPQERLVVHSAVLVEPLTKQQVETYLEQAGPALAAVRTVLHTNPVLQELTTTPLMLGVLTLTYAGAVVQDLPQHGSADEQQRQIFTAYVERMVMYKGDVVHYPLERTKAWLGWLGQMRAHFQSVFYLEHLQPDWLAPEQKRPYVQLAVLLPGILIGLLAGLGFTVLVKGVLAPALMIPYGLLGGLLGGLWSKASGRRASPSQQIEGHHRQGYGRFIGGCLATSVLIGLLFGLSSRSMLGVAFGLVSLLLQLALPVVSRHIRLSENSVNQRWKRLARPMQTIHGQRALVVAAAVGLSYGLNYGLILGPIFGLGYGLAQGLNYGLLSILVSLILEGQAEGIHLTERLRWTRGSLTRSLLTPKQIRRTLLLACTGAVGFGLSQGLDFGLVQGLNSGLGQGLSMGLAGLSTGLVFGLILGLNYWILWGLLHGISSEQVEDRFRRVPNQGIQQSFHSSLLMGIIGLGVIGVAGTLSIMLQQGLPSELNYVYSWLTGLKHVSSLGLKDVLSPGLRSGWFIGVCGGLLMYAIWGGLATLRHYSIRLLLWRSHTFPWNAHRFLDDATTRILLQRVGGGYSFVHRLILDYFADLEPTALTAAATQRKCSDLGQFIVSKTPLTLD
jgi:DNA polymerase III delta prime subunit